MSTKTIIRDEIENELGELGKLEVGSEEYKVAVDGVTKLVDKMVVLEKFQSDEENRRIDREWDHEFKLHQAKEEKKDRRVKNGLSFLGIAVPSGVAVWGALKTFKFEETGSVTSTVGKNFINKLFKK